MEVTSLVGAVWLLGPQNSFMPRRQLLAEAHAALPALVYPFSLQLRQSQSIILDRLVHGR